MNEERPKGFFEDAKTGLSWMTFIVRVLATSVEVFLHGRFGMRYLGIQALGVLLLIPLYSLFWEGSDVRPLVWFMMAYLAMCAVARVGSLWRTLRHQHEHSLYTGYPRSMRVLPRLDEITAKRAIEPVLVFLAGLFTLPHSEPLGSYFIVAAFGLFASVQLSLGVERLRAQDLYDAMIDQQNVTERFRELRGDRF